MNKQSSVISFDDLKPVNIIKNGLVNLLEPLDINKTVLVLSTSMAAVFITKKLIKSGSYTRLANILVPLILVGAIESIVDHPEKSKLAVKAGLKNIGKVLGASPDTTYFP